MHNIIHRYDQSASALELFSPWCRNVLQCVPF